MNFAIATAAVGVMVSAAFAAAQQVDSTAVQGPAAVVDSSVELSSDSAAGAVVAPRLRQRLFAAPAKKSGRVVPAHTLPESFPTVIPGGILFGEFQKEDGPFLIEGSVTVPSGQTLKFGPGSQVFIGGKYSTITVFGQLTAKGTAEEPIVFQSANAQPNPWDWDRIYCRSKNRAEFEHCVFRHSNYGLYVENGIAAVNNCTFEYNSLHGLVVRNSTVSLRSTSFDKGHVLAMLLEAGSVVTAESLTVKDNITGIACGDKGQLEMAGGEISYNTNGLVYAKNASVAIVATAVTKNRNGVVATEEIPRKMREMIFDNTIDSRVVAQAKMEELFKEPEEVKSVVLPKTKTVVEVADGFTPGFAATNVPREAHSSFIGNVSLGFKYYLPRSSNDLSRDTVYAEDDFETIESVKTEKVFQTRYPGEESDRLTAGLQPEMQVFISGRRGDADVNLLADFFGTQWTGFRKNMFNLSLDYADQEVVIGDFYENGNETSISGRKLTGLKFHGNALDMGRGNKRMGFKLAAGETEFPKDSGQNEIDLYNEVVDSAMSVRQQITYISELSVKPTHNSQVFVKGIIARDQDESPFLRDVLATSGAPKPIQAQSGAIGGEVELLQGSLVVGAEIDLGSHDTLTANDPIKWYNPEIPQSIGRVFGNFSDGDFFAGTVSADATLAGVNTGLRFTEIRSDYFSAGNPYLESDRRTLALSAEHQLNEQILLNGGYDFAQSYVSSEFDLDAGLDGSQFTNTVNLNAKYEPGEKKPAFALDYSLGLISQDQIGERSDSVVTTDDLAKDTIRVRIGIDSRELRNQVGFQYRQDFANGMDLTVRYRAALTNDITDYSAVDEPESRNDVQHQLTLRHSFRVKKIVTNKANVRLALKTKLADDFFGYQYKFSDQVRITIIPRRLVLNLKGEYGERVDEQDSETGEERIAIETISYTVDGDVKVTLTSKLSLTVMGKYEVSQDENLGATDNYTVKIGGMSLTYLF